MPHKALNIWFFDDRENLLDFGLYAFEKVASVRICVGYSNNT
jgi:hypothetical protein